MSKLLAPLMSMVQNKYKYYMDMDSMDSTGVLGFDFGDLMAAPPCYYALMQCVVFYRGYITRSPARSSAGMPNILKNPFFTDLYHLFQSTDKQLLMDEFTDFFLLGSATTPPPPPNPLHFRDSWYVARAE